MELSVHNLPAWQRHFLEQRRGTLPRPLLDTAAHLLLYLDDAGVLHELALEHLLQHYGAGRADLGFGSPAAETYAPLRDCRASADIPTVQRHPFPNHDPGVQVVWRAPQGVTLDVRRDPLLTRLRPNMLGTLGLQSKLAHRLEGGGQVFGLLCIDQVGEERRWREAETSYLHQFAAEVLSPLLLASQQLAPAPATKFSAAEREALSLLALGLTSKEIARRLGKSPNTVENQLSALRRRTGARNRVELLRIWEAATLEKP